MQRKNFDKNLKDLKTFEHLWKYKIFEKPAEKRYIFI